MGGLLSRAAGRRRGILLGLLALGVGAAFLLREELPYSLGAEWRYRAILHRQQRALRQVDGIWRQAELGRWSGRNGWRELQARIEESVRPVREEYEVFLQRNPGHDRAMTSLGTLLEDTGRPEEAFAWWSRAAELAKDNPQLLNNLANHHGHSGDPTRAIRLYEEAARLAPREAVFHYNLGNMYYLFRKETGRVHGWDLETVLAKSLEQFRLARECDRRNFDYATSYAETFYGVNFLLRNRPWQEALSAWEECLRLPLAKEQRDFVRVNIVRVSAYLRDPLRAMAAYSEIVSEEQRKLAGRLLRRAFPESFDDLQEA